ncbi:hypothetical protein BB558_001672, partial [Smittium angustum]
MSQTLIQVSMEQVVHAEKMLVSKDSEINDLRNHLIQAEIQFNSASHEHQELLKDRDAYKSMFNNSDKKSAELATLVNQLNQTLLERDLKYSKNKIEAYERTSNLQSSSEARTAPNFNTGGDSIKSISKIPTFEGKSIAFNRWINGVTEIFDNYPLLKDFQKRALVVESLKGSARDWYDAKPDDNVTSWDSFKSALMSQYGGMHSTDHALERIDALRLTPRSEFKSFIQQIRPAIKAIALNNHSLAIALLRKQIDPEIKKY